MTPSHSVHTSLLADAVKAGDLLREMIERAELCVRGGTLAPAQLEALLDAAAACFDVSLSCTTALAEGARAARDASYERVILPLVAAAAEEGERREVARAS